MKNRELLILSYTCGKLDPNEYDLELLQIWLSWFKSK